MNPARANQPMRRALCRIGRCLAPVFLIVVAHGSQSDFLADDSERSARPLRLNSQAEREARSYVRAALRRTERLMGVRQ